MGGAKASAEFTAMLEYVRITWPFWDRSHGMDHVMVAGGRFGACELFDGHPLPGAVQVPPYPSRSLHHHCWKLSIGSHSTASSSTSGMSGPSGSL
jgi:hypothetical protein